MVLNSGSSAVRSGSGGGQASGSEASHGGPSHHRQLLRSSRGGRPRETMCPQWRHISTAWLGQIVGCL